MGTGEKAWTGALAANPTVYDIDGFDNPAGTITALRARGDRVICYIEVGAAESYRPDYGQFPKVALGKAVPGYPEERYVDLSNPAVSTVIRARITMCHDKGFDAVEPDIDDSYSDDNGFHLTETENVAYDRALAAYAHSLGLAWGQKNGDADQSFAAQVSTFADFLLDEQCFEFDTCSVVGAPYLQQGKAVFEVEYNIPTSAFCRQANALGFDSERMNVALAGGRQPCR